MARLLFIISFISVLLNPSPIFGLNPVFLEVAETMIMSYVTGLQEYNIDPGSNQPDQSIQELHDRFEALETKIDQNYNNVIEKLNNFLQDFQLLQDTKKLSDNYREMKRIFTKLTKWLNKLGNNTKRIPKSFLPSVERLDSLWSETRKLVTTQAFFTQLSSNWEDTYKTPWKGPCFTYMSDLRLRYTQFMQYMSFAKNYFVSGYILYSIYEAENDDVSWMKEDFVSNLQEDLDADVEYFQKIMKGASREYWACDPEKQTEGPFFYELQAYTTYYTVQENLPESCVFSCSDVSVKSCTSVYDDGLCIRTRKCNGPLLSCGIISQGMNMCIKDENNELNSTTYRRYLHIDNTLDYSGKECQNTISTLRYDAAVHGGGMLTQWEKYNRLNYYKCLCRENEYYISTFPVMASPGYVVVGAQWKLHGNTLYIAIYEGQLQSDGSITDERWAPESSDEPDWLKQRDVLDKDTEIELSPTMVTEDENRVVTGVQFAKTDNHLHLTIYSEAVDLKTGLFVPQTAQVEEKITFATEEFNLDGVDRPDKSDQENNPVSDDSQYVKFQVTSLLEDGGQATIPFIDNQLIYPYPVEALSGIGLYIRGQQGYGGFLAIKLYTHDLSPYIRKGTRLADGIKKVEDMPSEEK